jgi:hypothetical protein
MTADEKIEFRRLAIWLFAIWVSYIAIVPQVYPPRNLTEIDYMFMLLIPAGAFFSVRPGVSWRWLLYYGVLASLPFIIALTEKLQTNYELRSHFSEPSVSMIYLPCLLHFAALVVAASMGGILGAVVKTRSSKLSPSHTRNIMKSFRIIGLVGLAITTALNLVALLILKKASAEYFSDQWWSDWFPSYIVWLVFVIIGLASCCWQKSGDTKHDA